MDIQYKKVFGTDEQEYYVTVMDYDSTDSVFVRKGEYNGDLEDSRVWQDHIMFVFYKKVDKVKRTWLGRKKTFQQYETFYIHRANPTNLLRCISVCLKEDLSSSDFSYIDFVKQEIAQGMEWYEEARDIKIKQKEIFDSKKETFDKWECKPTAMNREERLGKILDKGK